MPQTMAGVRFAPEIGLAWDSIHRIHVGINALHEFGSNMGIDAVSPIAYYQYDRAPFRFYMGAFPRETAVGNYSRFFFQDSISYYRPNINGILWQIYNKKANFDVWLDWTGRQSPTAHETFYIGMAGRYKMGLLYLQHMGYMFHYAGVMNPAVPEALHDNGMYLTSIGIDLAKKTGFEKLDINFGWAVGVEDARGEVEWQKHNGFMMDTKIEYRGIGILNSFYKGAGQMSFYADHGANLYWADPIYRASTYNRTDLYLRMFQSEKLKIKFEYSLHFVENKVYHEQSLKVTANINNYKKSDETPYRYLWSKWFRK